MSSNIFNWPSIQKVFNKTISQDLIPAKPMSAPSAIMPFVDFAYSPDWLDKYLNAINAIRVKIVDTFDNILDFFNRTDIIVSKVIGYRCDTKFINSYCKGVIGNYDNDLKYFFGMSENEYADTLEQLGVFGFSSHPDDPGEPGDPGICVGGPRKSTWGLDPFTRYTDVEIEMILYAPTTPIVIENSIATLNQQSKGFFNFNTPDTFSDISCEKLIDLIYKE